MTPHRTNLNTLLRTLRDRTGLNQIRFAAVYQVGSASTVERAEARPSPPSRVTLRKYARWEKRGPVRAEGGHWPALGVSMERLVEEARKARTATGQTNHQPPPDDPDVAEAIEEAATAFARALRRIARR